MKHSYLVSFIMLVVGIAGGLAANRLLLAQQEAVKRTMLLQTDLEDAPGKEANVFLIEMAPGASTGRHSHPGTEIAFILEGSATVEMAGKTGPVTQQRGTVSHLTPNEVHNVSNSSRSEPLKAIVFALYEKGKPKVAPPK